MLEQILERVLLQYIVLITVTRCYNRLQKNCFVVHRLYCIKVRVVCVAEFKPPPPNDKWSGTLLC